MWSLLRDAGVPGLADHRSPTNAPHVTVLAAEALGASVDEAVRAAVASTAAPLPVLRLGGLVVFGVPPRGLVLARQVVVDAPLLRLHTALHAAVDGVTGPDTDGDEAVTMVPHTRPGSWTPHISIALRLTTEQLGAAVAALGRVDPLDVQVEALRRWDPRDHTTTDLA